MSIDWTHESGRRLKLRWRFGWWGTLLAPESMRGCVWSTAKVRPRWYWLWRRVGLFLRIVWRRHEGRLGIALAWNVSYEAVGLSIGNPKERIPIGVRDKIN